MKNVAMIIGVLLIVAVVVFGYVHVNRWWHYNTGYESQVSRTICDMIQPQYLKDVKDCE